MAPPPSTTCSAPPAGEEFGHFVGGHACRLESALVERSTRALFTKGAARLDELVPHDGLITARADADRRDTGSGEFLDALNVGPGVCRELLERAAARDVLEPARQLFRHGDRV